MSARALGIDHNYHAEYEMTVVSISEQMCVHIEQRWRPHIFQPGLTLSRRKTWRHVVSVWYLLRIPPMLARLSKLLMSMLRKRQASNDCGEGQVHIRR